MVIEWLPSFNAGELDPRMDARAGLEKYQAGCRVLKNFVPVPFGGVSKRPGTLFLAETHNSSRKARIEPFRYSTTTQYLIEFGHNTMRFMAERRLVTNIGEFSHVDPWKTATVYTVGQLILNGSTYWRANAAHTANPSNKFDAVVWKNVFTSAVGWTPGMSFAAGDIARRTIAAGDIGYFEAIFANVATATNGPTVGTVGGGSNATWLRVSAATAQWRAGLNYLARNGITAAYVRTLASPSDTVAATYTRALTIVTITKVAHGRAVGDSVEATFLTGGALNGIYTVATVPTADTYTVVTAASGTIATSSCSYVPITVAATYARALTVTTVTKVAHGRAVGDIVLCDFKVGGEIDGLYQIQTVPTADTFTLKSTVSGTIAAGQALNYGVAQYWQSQMAHGSDSNNDPGGSPPWAVDIPGPETTFVIATPWTEEEIFDVQFLQVNDIVILCHPDHAPQLLTRTHSDFFTLEEIAWDWPPLRDENIRGTAKLTPSLTTGDITLTASENTFEVGHIGASFALAWAATSRTTEIKIQSTVSATYDSPAITVSGRWNAFSFNYWDGTWQIQRSYDNFVTYETIRSYRGTNGDRNFNTSGEETRECKMRLHFVGIRFAYSGGASYDAHGLLEIIDHREWGIVKITGITSPTTAQATVTRTLPFNTATHLWAEGAFSTLRGYPRTVCFHAGRIFYGGTASEPMRLWGSVTDDFYNFRRSSLADGSLAVTIASTAQHTIQWLASGTNALLVGTQAREYVVEAQNDAPLSPGNITAHPQSAYGSAYMPAILVNYVTLFVQRSRLSVREFVFSLERNGFVAADMTKLASHIVNPGLKQWAFQQSFNAIVWAVTSDGVLVGLTYEREENVVGWHRHETQGNFESVAILYGAEGGSDEIYLIAKRTIDGVEKRYIELMQPDAFERQRDNEKEECVMMDSAIVLRGTSVSEITGLSHLEGKTIQVLADGAKRPDAVVEGGIVTLTDPASVVIAGLSYEAVIKPMRLELQMRDGTAQTRGFKLHKLAMRVFQSLGGQVRSDDETSWQTIRWRDTDDLMGEPPPLFTGEKELSMDSKTGDSLDFSLRSNDPHPFTLIALAPKFSVEGQSLIFAK